MRKNVITIISLVLLVSSCGTYTGAGAYTGMTLGSILGSAIGGLSDGPRGSDLGTIVGMAGGAVIGATIGNDADQKAKEEVNARRGDVRDQRGQEEKDQDSYAPNSQANINNGSGFDETNSGDDRIYDFNGSDYNGNYTVQQPTTQMPESSSLEKSTGGFSYSSFIEIRNARFIDDNQDGIISSGELCKVIFEVINSGQTPLYDVQPTVIEANGNKHIFISPGIHVEKINPHKGIRYTALVKADNRLKDGTAKICIFIIQGDNHKISKVTEFNIPTRGR